MHWLNEQLKTSWPGIFLLGVLLLCVPIADAQGRTNRAIPDVLVHIDTSDSTRYAESNQPMAVIVDKHRQRINLYGFDDYWRNLAKWPCSTGKISGPKMVEGDHKTPEGVFFVIRDVGERYLSSVYGARALPLDYPNWLDRWHHKSGSAIWLHGTDRPLKPLDSNGCVVLDNDSINQLARHIRLNRTPVIIVDRIRLCSAKKSRATAESILVAMDQWHRAMMYGDYFGYSHWYADDHKPSMTWWRKWCRQRRKYAADNDYLSTMRQRAIYRLDPFYVMLFDHVLIRGSRQSWAGRRKLYLTLQDDKVRIMKDIYQPRVFNGEDPLLLAWRTLWQSSDVSGELASGKTGEQRGRPNI